jgi:signal transduction histidine kinase/CheY-like chemotaxis protein
LLHSSDWTSQLDTTLANLGQAVQADRVYIFENHTTPAGTLLTSQRAEWAAPGVAPQRDNPALQNVPLRPGFERWIKLLGQRQPVFGQVADFPPAEQALLAPQGILSVLVVPIFVTQDWWGFIGFDDCRLARAWSGLEIETLQIAADIVGAAIRRARNEESLRQHQRRTAALEEREHIGRELHDGLAQALGYVSMQAQAIQTLLATGQSDTATPMLAQLARVAQDAHTDVRQYILGMRPAAPGQDFIHTLQDYAAMLELNYGLRVQISAPAWPPNALTAESEAEVWRIIQEALMNVRKHAGVTTAQVVCAAQGDQVQIIIADAGCGFLLPAAPAAGHLGLAIMRERAQALGGAIEWRAAPGQGAQVIVTLPCCAVSLPPAGNTDRPLRVAIVDDHPLFLDGLRNLLTAHGVQVVGIGRDGVQAQELARLQPDIMLLDVTMPVCDGVQATQRIKALYPQLKIVLLTVEAKEQVLFAALQAGASGYLLKNLRGAELLLDFCDGQ